MELSELEELIRKSLDTFYQRRINKLSGLKLKDTLRKKNPYLFRAVGIQKASEIVERLLSDYMSSSDEGIFGDAFFEPIGHGYGRKKTEPTGTCIYRRRSGQAFWEELTGDPDFYLKLISLMRDHPGKHRVEFEEEWAKAVNRFELQFLSEFSTEEGGINWEKLTRFNSGVAAASRTRNRIN